MKDVTAVGLADNHSQLETRKMKTATLVLLLAVVAGSMAQNYCNVCSDHTMCKYRSPGPRCSRILKSSLSSTDRKHVVDTHNEVRARIAAGKESLGSNGRQPAAANMREMVWDNELATIAQRWADQCTLGHDSCRKLARSSVGQNVFHWDATSVPKGFDWRVVVKTWYSEVKNFNKNNISPFKPSSKPALGYFSQVVWATSTRVGCGFTQFPVGKLTRSMAVCNYGPGGNAKGKSMYIRGRACSKCPGATKCKNGLCGW